MDAGDAELDAFLEQNHAARAAYERRIRLAQCFLMFFERRFMMHHHTCAQAALHTSNFHA